MTPVSNIPTQPASATGTPDPTGVQTDAGDFAGVLSQSSSALRFSEPAGRGFLQWEGKHIPHSIPVPRLEICEAFNGIEDGAEDSAEDAATPNRLYHGDNLAAASHLLAHGWAEQFRLIYIDPPFDSGLAYARKVRSRGPQRRNLGESVQYRDIWPGDTYLQFMYERLLLLRGLLAPNGVLWLHCDYRQAHRLQLILEEVFGQENYLNTIAWRSQVARGAKVNAFYFPNSTHFLHVFAKDRRAGPVWHPPRKRLTFTRRQAAAQFMQDAQGFFRTSDPGAYSFERLQELHAAGRLYAPYNGDIHIDEASRTISCTNGGNIGVKYYLAQEGKNRFSVERAVDNLWDDIPGLGTTPGEDVGYPTQKTEALLERVIGASTEPGDWVLDCFAGSGTTPAVAQRMGRRWVACDLSTGAIQSTRRRLYTGAATVEHPTPGFVLYRATDNPTSNPADSSDDGGENRQAQPDNAPVDPSAQDIPARHTVKIAVQIIPRENAYCVTIQPADDRLPDWRARIDSVEIDPAHNGKVFRPTQIDAPENRRELIAGEYALPYTKIGNTLAVRVTQVTGHEEMFMFYPTPDTNR